MLAPVDPSADTPVARFLRRHGPHASNLAFWVRDCRGLAQQLLDRGVRVAVRGGGIVDQLPARPFDYVVTHPKDTFGTVFEFLEYQPIHDPRHRPWWSSSFWRDRHPLGIEGLSHGTVAVADLEAAARIYADALGCKLVHEEEDANRGTRSLFFAIGDTLVELASPASPASELARHLERHGPIVYGFTFRVRDLGRAVQHAREHGIDAIARDGYTVELDPARTFGVVFAFTERGTPGESEREGPP
jgi:4-hydroxyphenylpyruvate dioxygenase-like putative hemolysin